MNFNWDSMKNKIILADCMDIAIELDANYHKASCERLEALRSQGRLFV